MTWAADFLGGKRCLICRTWLPKDHFPQVKGGVYTFVKYSDGSSGDTDHQATSGEALPISRQYPNRIGRAFK